MTVHNVELYTFDDVDDESSDLEESEYIVGDVSVDGSILTHIKSTDETDHRQNIKTEILLRELSTVRRFRYATERNKPDGVGVLMRGSEYDFVLLSDDQSLADMYNQVEEAIE